MLGAAAARRTADYVDGAYRFCILEGRSHWLPEQAPDQIAPLLLDHLSLV
jgi:pimeloyl-ACP methyl ester carboxylesterase